MMFFHLEASSSLLAGSLQVPVDVLGKHLKTHLWPTGHGAQREGRGLLQQSCLSTIKEKHVETAKMLFA